MDCSGAFRLGDKLRRLTNVLSPGPKPARLRTRKLHVAPRHAQEEKQYGSYHICSDRNVCIPNAQHWAKRADDRHCRLRRLLKKYEACVTSKIPAAQKTTFQAQLDQMRKAWSDAAKNADAKATLESICKQSAEQMKAAMSGFGCTF